MFSCLSDMCSSPRNYPLPPHRPCHHLLFVSRVACALAEQSSSCCCWSFKNTWCREYPGGPVVKTSCFHCRDMCSFLSQGARTPHAKWCGQKKKRSRMPHVLASAACLLGSSTCCPWWDPAGVLSPARHCTSPCI